MIFILTPLAVFQDIERIAFKCSGFSAHEIFMDIRDWHKREISKSPEQIKSTKEKLMNWLHQFDFNKVAIRLENLIQALEIDRKIT